MPQAKSVLIPNWLVKPAAVHALVTTREGGISKTPYHSLNLGDHVGDGAKQVLANRAILNTHIPQEPIWLEQVHGTHVSTPQSRRAIKGAPIKADAAVSDIPNEVLTILTADCLPVLLASDDGKVIGAAHAGWRGLCNGVLENTVTAMLALSPHLSVANISVWLGPAIGPQAFEVGTDVLDAFTQSGKALPDQAFIALEGSPGKYFANLYLLAKSRLNEMGIVQIEGGEFCTFTDQSHFFSFRRDGQTGRIASCIWMSG